MNPATIYLVAVYVSITGDLGPLNEGDDMTLKCELFFDPKPEPDPRLDKQIKYDWQFEADSPGLAIEPYVHVRCILILLFKDLGIMYNYNDNSIYLFSALQS